MNDCPIAAVNLSSKRLRVLLVYNGSFGVLSCGIKGEGGGGFEFDHVDDLVSHATKNLDRFGVLRRWTFAFGEEAHFVFPRTEDELRSLLKTLEL